MSRGKDLEKRSLLSSIQDDEAGLEGGGGERRSAVPGYSLCCCSVVGMVLPPSGG